MTTLWQSIEVLGDLFVNSAFIGILFLLLVRKYFPKIDIVNALRILKWLLVAYAVILSFMILSSIFAHHIGPVFYKRITGQYKWAYWIMILANAVCPLFLIFKRIGNNIWLLFIIAIFINCGWLLESTIIHLSGFLHSELTILGKLARLLPREREVIIILAGIIYGIILLIIGNFIKTKKALNRQE